MPNSDVDRPRRCSRLLSRVVVLIFALLAAAPAVAVGPTPATPSRPPALEQTAPPKMSRTWKRARSTNFVAVGDAPDWRLRAVLEDLEAFRWAFLKLHPNLRLTSPVPTIVVLFKDWNSFTRFQPRDEKGKREDYVAGYPVDGPESHADGIPG